jgi:hypothetical protein
MTRQDAAWLHRPSDVDSECLDCHSVTKYDGKLKEPTSKRYWFNGFALFVLFSCFVASLRVAGCLGGK